MNRKATTIYMLIAGCCYAIAIALFAISLLGCNDDTPLADAGVPFGDGGIHDAGHDSGLEPDPECVGMAPGTACRATPPGSFACSGPYAELETTAPYRCNAAEQCRQNPAETAERACAEGSLCVSTRCFAVGTCDTSTSGTSADAWLNTCVWLGTDRLGFTPHHYDPAPYPEPTSVVGVALRQEFADGTVLFQSCGGSPVMRAIGRTGLQLQVRDYQGPDGVAVLRFEPEQAQADAVPGALVYYSGWTNIFDAAVVRVRIPATAFAGLASRLGISAQHFYDAANVAELATPGGATCDSLVIDIPLFNAL